MKTEFLTGLGLEREIVDKIMAENGRDIEKHKKRAETLEIELAGTKEQLSAATTEIQSYKDMDVDGIKASAVEWEQKYQQDTEALKTQLEQQKYTHAAERAVDGLAFSSNAARKAFVDELTAKNLPIENDKLMGFDDFVNGYKETDPGAFASDRRDPPPPYAPGPGVGPQNQILRTPEQEKEFKKRKYMGLPIEGGK